MVEPHCGGKVAGLAGLRIITGRTLICRDIIRLASFRFLYLQLRCTYNRSPFAPPLLPPLLSHSGYAHFPALAQLPLIDRRFC